MRGAHHDHAAPMDMPRIIPADAGSTQTAAANSHLMRDHPRGCGEHYGWPGGVDLSEGSSPRMRGAL